MNKIIFLTLFFFTYLMALKIETAYINNNEHILQDSNLTVESKQINLILKIINVKEQTPIKVKWIAVNAVNIPNFLIYTQQYVLKDDGYLIATLKRGDKKWPPGKYMVEFYINNQKIFQKIFYIKPLNSIKKVVKENKFKSKKIKSLILATKIKKIDENIKIVKKQNIFKSKDKFYIVIEYENGNKNDEIYIKWWYLNGGKKLLFVEGPGRFNKQKGFIVGEISIEGGEWKKGNYAIEVVINKKVEAKTEFVIQK
jgi:hypothetical protein